jgi:hypothetical protein
LLALCCLSCSRGGALHPVRGKVLYKNQPIAGVVVTFHPKLEDMHTLLPVGQTKEDGTFTLRTGPNEGAPAGEYVITFIHPQQAEPQGKKKGMTMTMQRFTPEDRFKGVYAQRSSSKFWAEIRTGTNELEPFQLK